MQTYDKTPDLVGKIIKLTHEEGQNWIVKPGNDYELRSDCPFCPAIDKQVDTGHARDGQARHWRERDREERLYFIHPREITLFRLPSTWKGAARVRVKMSFQYNRADGALPNSNTREPKIGKRKPARERWGERRRGWISDRTIKDSNFQSRQNKRSSPITTSPPTLGQRRKKIFLLAPSIINGPLVPQCVCVCVCF